jgi:hypothetical protein
MTRFVQSIAFKDVSMPSYLNYSCWTVELPSGRAIQGVGLRAFACWDRGFDFCQGHGCLSLVRCVLSGRGLCEGTIHSSGGVLPSVVCLGVISKPQQWGWLWRLSPASQSYCWSPLLKSRTFYQMIIFVAYPCPVIKVQQNSITTTAFLQTF